MIALESTAVFSLGRPFRLASSRLRDVLVRRLIGAAIAGRRGAFRPVPLLTRGML